MTNQTMNRRAALQSLGAGAAALTLPGCAATSVTRPAAAPPTDATAALDAIAWRLLEHSPGEATSLGVDTGEKAYLRARLDDRSPAGVAALGQTLRTDLALAESIHTARLDPATRTSVEVVRTAYRTALEGMALPYGDVAVGGWRNTPYVVIQNVGGYIDYPRFLDATHPVRDKADAEAYLARLAAIPANLAGERERIAEAREQGLVPPDFLLDKAIPQMQSALKDAMAGGGYVESLRSRTKDIPGDWEARARAITTQQIAPALEAQLAELYTQRKLAGSAPGMREQPGGEAWYAWGLKASTTTTSSPAEIHAMGMEELARLQGEMEPIFATLGYTQGSSGERMGEIAKDPRFQFAEGDPGRDEIRAFIQQRIDWIKGEMPRAFRTLAPGNVEVRRLPLSEEPGAPSAYGGAGSIDGSIPGKMWINLRTTDLHRKYDLPTLVHHEAIPGHVWQGEYSNRLPLIRSILAFNAYSEGWALYAEQLADELGAYESDPVGRLGYLQNQAWRAARMVVDTGLHAMGWPRQRAIDYFRREVGLSLSEVTSEVDRYCSWPGQACGYMMGRLVIDREREEAKAALGTAYDLRDFNQALVDGGNVPLDVLAGNVARYVAQNRA